MASAQIEEPAPVERETPVQWVMDPSPQPSALDSHEGGDHYKQMGDYQPWQVAAKWLTPEELKGAMKLTVMAYLARESDKGGRQDIKKAMHTMQIYLELTEDGAES